MQPESNLPGGVFIALPFLVFLLFFAGFALFMGVVFFRALRGGKNGRPFSSAGQSPSSTDSFANAPLIMDDSLTNPANPLYHVHHPPAHSSSDLPSSHSADFGSSHTSSPSIDSGSSGTSFDSGSTSSGSMDSGGASGGCSSP